MITIRSILIPRGKEKLEYSKIGSKWTIPSLGGFIVIIHVKFGERDCSIISLVISKSLILRPTISAHLHYTKMVPQNNKSSCSLYLGDGWLHNQDRKSVV